MVVEKRKMARRGETNPSIIFSSVWHRTTQVGLDSTSRNRDDEDGADDAQDTANSRVTVVASPMR